jgi:hypothetical protein
MIGFLTQEGLILDQLDLLTKQSIVSGERLSQSDFRPPKCCQPALIARDRAALWAFKCDDRRRVRAVRQMFMCHVASTVQCLEFFSLHRPIFFKIYESYGRIVLTQINHVRYRTFTLSFQILSVCRPIIHSAQRLCPSPSRTQDRPLVVRLHIIFFAPINRAARATDACTSGGYQVAALTCFTSYLSFREIMHS